MLVFWSVEEVCRLAEIIRNIQHGQRRMQLPRKQVGLQVGNEEYLRHVPFE